VAAGEVIPQRKEKKMTITGIDIPFLDMLTFMIKWAVASIPAFIILAIAGFIVYLILISIHAYYDV